MIDVVQEHSGEDVEMISHDKEEEKVALQVKASSESEESTTVEFMSKAEAPCVVVKPRRKGLKKRVSWNGIQTREYAPVVGDHPLCCDGLPVSLGWSFCDSSSDDLAMKAGNVRERKSSYVFPRRLSYEDRRERLLSISGLTAEEVKNDEIDLVVRTLKESWDNVEEEEPPVVVDPLADISMWEDTDVPCMDLDVDLGDISDFEWTD